MPQKQAVLGVIHDLESFFGIEAIGVSLEGLWNSNLLRDAKGEKLFDFLDGVRSFPIKRILVADVDMRLAWSMAMQFPATMALLPAMPNPI